MTPKEIMDIMNDIEYGFKDENGNNLAVTNPEKYDEEFYEFYYLLTPDELRERKCGVCWDQVELEREIFLREGYNISTFFICTYDRDMLPSHTFLTINDGNKYYWFEYSWGMYRGIHEYSSLKELLLDVKAIFIANNPTDNEAYTFIHEYQKPKFHIGCEEFYEYIKTQELVKINEPLYFYHVVNKDADMSLGLLSLKYMYDHGMNDLFDDYAQKYIERITGGWDIPKYKGKLTLTREEILDALNIIRGQYGGSYLYFFRYPLYKELGPKIESLLNTKVMYRININDEEVQECISDLFYGFDQSNSDNKVLDRAYYENVSKDEYFSKYNDDEKLNFAALNHIAIAFKDDYCPIEFLEKVDEIDG